MCVRAPPVASYWAGLNAWQAMTEDPHGNKTTAMCLSEITTIILIKANATAIAPKPTNPRPRERGGGVKKTPLRYNSLYGYSDDIRLVPSGRSRLFHLLPPT